MPIRHCQKCSLKVLIDESQAGVSPFYCQRCTAALKGDGATADVLAPAARRASSPRLTPVPAPSAVAVAVPPTVGKSSTVKVFCPYCKASFNGKIPSKPARGSCPLCQKDLILLPNGDIRPAADFDLAKWQNEGSGSEAAEESGTQVMVKKYAAHPVSTSDRAEGGKKVLEEKAESSPADETAASEEGVELPSWLDESDRLLKTKNSAAITAPPDTDEAAPVRLEDMPDAAAAEPEPEPEPVVPPARRSGPVPRVQVQAPASPPPVPAKSASQSTASVPAVKKAALRREKTERRAAPAGEVVATSSGAGKLMLSLLLTALPLIACPILLSSRDKMREGFMATMGARFVKGFKELDTRLFPVEVEAPPAPPPPKPVEAAPDAPAKPTAEDQRNMEDEINKRWIEYKREERTFKQRSVGATPQEKAEFQKVETDLKGKLSHIDQLRATYKKLFGKDHDPTKQ
jgi:hypothetical protein